MNFFFFSIITLIISIVMFIACSSENLNSEKQLSQNLANFEKKINQKNLDKPKEFSKEDLKSGFNNYDYYGQNLLNSMENLATKISVLKSSSKSNLDQINPLIIEESDKLNTSNITFNENEKKLFDSFVSNLIFDNCIERANAYEKFVFDNYADQSEVENFLIAISIIKYTSYEITSIETVSHSKSVRQWEYCVDKCMDDTFRGYNAVDWFFFIAGNPGLGVLQAFASCGWDCF